MVALRRPEEWIERLIDADTFVPLLPSKEGRVGFGDEVITGFAKVSGRPIALFVNDPQVKQGYVTSKGAIKIRRLMDRTLELGIPLVALLNSPGVSVEEGAASGDEYASVLMGHCELSGVVPQLAGVMGANIGAPAYSATLMDLSFFSRLRSYICVSGPGVVLQALGEKATYQELGGSAMHASKTGLAHFVDATMDIQLQRMRWILDFLPSNFREDPPKRTAREPRQKLPHIPSEPEVGFDVNELIGALVDDSEWMEYAADFGPSMVNAFAYMGGHAVGVVANQSLHLSGALDCEASQKTARFVRLCDSYNIPIVTLIDAPGFMPGVQQEQLGILRQGALLCQAMYTKVPKLSVTFRKCYGASAIVLGQTLKWKGDLTLALETSRLAVMGFHAAKDVVYREELQACAHDAEQTKAKINELKNRYYRDYEDPQLAYRLGLIDEVIPIEKLRATFIRHLDLVERKRDRKREPVRGVFP